MHDPAITLIEATERLERAERGVTLALTGISTLTLTAPLRFKVEADERLRRSVAARDAARRAFEAAQDSDCPDAAA